MLTGSLLGGMATVASTLTAVGARKVGDATADAENVRDAQLSPVELRRGGQQEVRLAPLKLAQQLAEARLAHAADGVNRKRALPEPRSDQGAHDEVNDPSETHPPDSGDHPPPRGGARPFPTYRAGANCTGLQFHRTRARPPSTTVPRGSSTARPPTSRIFRPFLRRAPCKTTASGGYLPFNSCHTAGGAAARRPPSRHRSARIRRAERVVVRVHRQVG